jgi:hypothetical protein
MSNMNSDGGDGGNYVARDGYLSATPRISELESEIKNVQS